MTAPYLVLAELRWPILERIPIWGDAAISPHGIGTAAGFLLGAVLMIRRAELRGLGHVYVEDVSQAVQDLLFRAGIGAIIGARFFFVLTHLDVYLEDPARILMVWEGGLTFLGGLAGAILAVIPAARSRGYRPVQLLDSAAVGIALGLAVGRIGDLVIGDHIGEPTGSPLGWRCTGNFWDASTNSLRLADPLPPEPAAALGSQTQGCFDVAVHQTALYDLAHLVPLVVLLLLLERRPRWDGFFLAVFVYWYGVMRFAMDFFREDRRLLGLTGSQYALVAAMVGITVFLVWYAPWRRRPWAWDPPDFDHPWRTPDAPKGDRPEPVRADAGGTETDGDEPAEGRGSPPAPGG